VRAASFCADYYRKCLHRSPEALAYLESRQYADPAAIAERYGIGYAPGRALSAAFRKSTGLTEVADTLLEQIGVLKDPGDRNGEPSGRLIEHLRDRLTFEIKRPVRIERAATESREEVVGFGGRIMGDGEPKYLNTRETALFSKGKTLYGLPWATRVIRERKQVLVAEGYFDVIRLHEAGFTNAVAALGTSLTEGHLKQVLRFASRSDATEWVFCMDDDKAGWDALLRGAELVLSYGFVVSVAVPPGGKDPDAAIRDAGPDVMRAALANRKPVLTTILERLDKAGGWRESLDELLFGLEQTRALVGAASAVRRPDLARQVTEALGTAGYKTNPLVMGNVLNPTVTDGGLRHG
jgi:DNA primase